MSSEQEKSTPVGRVLGTILERVVVALAIVKQNYCVIF